MRCRGYHHQEGVCLNEAVHSGLCDQCRSLYFRDLFARLKGLIQSALVINIG